MSKRSLSAKALGAFVAIFTAIMAVNAWGSQSIANPDEAQTVGVKESAFVHSDDESYFREMDNGVTLTQEERIGRNMWLLWSGGNDRFWDVVTKDSAATFDLLKVVTSHPTQTYCQTSKGNHCDRDTRWEWLGAINEPCFEKPNGPDPNRFDLYLDVRSRDCGPDPFEDESKYPGVKIGARGTTFRDGSKLPVGSFYGYATGILGLRLFPNPNFDQAAKDRWDPDRYYTDPNYYQDPNLVRPYRVGMTCAFCHVGPSPIHPPADPAKPKFENLNSTVGSQYLWMDRVFVYSADETNFLYQLLHAYPPGTMDTSLVSSDYILNPRTMNAIYLLRDRLNQALSWGKETLKGDELNNKQLPEQYTFTDPTNSEAKPLFVKPDTSYSARILKDGADSVGILGALNRVYLNIGVYSEEWLKHFTPFFGMTRITPIEISAADDNSTYWRATVAGTLQMAAFLLKAGQPDKLPETYVTADMATLDRGKKVFAETCARQMDSGFDGFIVRTEDRSFLKIPKPVIDAQVSTTVSAVIEGFAPACHSAGAFEFPIPKGFPIGLAASLPSPADSIRSVWALLQKGIHAGSLCSNPNGISDDEALDWAKQAKRNLVTLSKCPDYVVNRGHYFGTDKFNETDGLSDDEKAFGKETPLSKEDKGALIEFLKTF